MRLRLIIFIPTVDFSSCHQRDSQGLISIAKINIVSSMFWICLEKKLVTKDFLKSLSGAGLPFIGNPLNVGADEYEVPSSHFARSAAHTNRKSHNLSGFCKTRLRAAPSSCIESGFQEHLSQNWWVAAQNPADDVRSSLEDTPDLLVSSRFSTIRPAWCCKVPL